MVTARGRVAAAPLLPVPRHWDPTRVPASGRFAVEDPSEFQPFVLGAHWERRHVQREDWSELGCRGKGWGQPGPACLGGRRDAAPWMWGWERARFHPQTPPFPPLTAGGRAWGEMGSVAAVPGGMSPRPPALCHKGCPAGVPGEEEGTGAEEWEENLQLQQ